MFPAWRLLPVCFTCVLCEKFILSLWFSTECGYCSRFRQIKDFQGFFYSDSTFPRTRLLSINCLWNIILSSTAPLRANRLIFANSSTTTSFSRMAVTSICNWWTCSALHLKKNLLNFSSSLGSFKIGVMVDNCKLSTSDLSVLCLQSPLHPTERIAQYCLFLLIFRHPWLFSCPLSNGLCFASA